MNKRLKKALMLALLAGTPFLVNAADSKSDVPKKPTAGLQIECHPEKRKFVIGEPVTLRCAITNTTDGPRPIGIYLPPLHFRLIKDEASWLSGVQPEVTLQIRLPITGNEYEILLPSHSQLDVSLALKSSSAQVFRGILVYDPDVHGGGFFGSDAMEKAKQTCLFTKPFEYEVIDAEAKK